MLRAYVMEHPGS
jgi:hypothetical protein